MAKLAKLGKVVNARWQSSTLRIGPVRRYAAWFTAWLAKGKVRSRRATLLALINKTWLTEILWLSKRQQEAINHRLGPLSFASVNYFALNIYEIPERKPRKGTVQLGRSVKLIRLCPHGETSNGCKWQPNGMESVNKLFAAHLWFNAQGHGHK